MLSFLSSRQEPHTISLNILCCPAPQYSLIFGFSSIRCFCLDSELGTRHFFRVTASLGGCCLGGIIISHFGLSIHPSFQYNWRRGWIKVPFVWKMTRAQLCLYYFTSFFGHRWVVSSISVLIFLQYNLGMFHCREARFKPGILQADALYQWAKTILVSLTMLCFIMSFLSLSISCVSHVILINIVYYYQYFNIHFPAFELLFLIPLH